MISKVSSSRAAARPAIAIDVKATIAPTIHAAAKRGAAVCGGGRAGGQVAHVDTLLDGSACACVGEAGRPGAVSVLIASIAVL